MLKKIIGINFLIVGALFISQAHAQDRGWIGSSRVNQVNFVESSALCGPALGRCLVIFFEGGAQGCNPASAYLSIRESHPSYKDFRTFALLSLVSTNKKFRTWGTLAKCGDADGIVANGANLYE